MRERGYDYIVNGKRRPRAEFLDDFLDIDGFRRIDLPILFFAAMTLLMPATIGLVPPILKKKIMPGGIAT